MGEWKKSMIEGKGLYAWGDGTIYRGWFARNQKQGQGELILSNGERFSGYWNKDVLENSTVISPPIGKLKFQNRKYTVV